MTNEDLILHLTALQVCERKDIERIRQEYQMEQQKMLDGWAKEHARFQIGDIINSNTVTIRVEKIVGRIGLRNIPYRIGLRNIPYVEYTGHALTAKLTVRKDGRITSIYDDSSERNIKKLK